MALSKAGRAQRLRAGALWAFVLAAFCLATALIGLGQYFFSGAVSLRPGHEALEGTPALERLASIVVVGALFAAIGAVLRQRAK